MNQVISRLGLIIGGCSLRIKDMKADMSFDHLSHESIHRTPASGNVM